MHRLTFLFDYAEVLSRAATAEDETRMADELDMRLDDFREAYWQHRPSYDLGGSAAGFWSAVSGADLAHRDREPLLRRLVGLDVTAWSHLDDVVVDVVRGLRSRGVPLVLLSNLPAELATAVRTGPLASLFDQMVFSSDVALAKPDPRLFTRVLDDLGIPAQAAVFVDDRPENLAGAAAVGIHAVPFDGSHRLGEQVARWLAPRATA